MNNEEVTVNIKYKEIEQTFTGNPDNVWTNVNKFFSEMIPGLRAIKNVLLTIDFENLLNDCKNLIAFTSEGPVVLVPKQKLTDCETILLHLLAAHIGNKLGYTKNSLTKEELKAGLEKSGKITSTRLGELVRIGSAIKTEEGNYRITTLGIKWFQEESLPQIREKIER